MTPEERFERIERNLEYVTQQNRSLEDNLNRLYDQHTAQAQELTDLRKLVAQIAQSVQVLAQSVDALLRMADLHERRISQLEEKS